jgi:glycosyltransferase involved in cell wall biosynthesis
MDERPENCPAVTVLICALNEEENLPHILPGIPPWVDEIILVDGHSTDRTVALAKEVRPEVKVLYQPGSGKGNALRHGVKEARGEIIVTIDADGETPPEEIGRFIVPLLEGNDFAKGSRLARGRPVRMPRYRGSATSSFPSPSTSFTARSSRTCAPATTPSGNKPLRN